MVRPVACLIVSFVAFVPASALAQTLERRLSKGISASIRLTDNADGTPSGAGSRDDAAEFSGTVPSTTTESARAETVLALSPFVALSIAGQRHELTLDARAELTRYIDEDRNAFEPNASLRTRSVLIDRFAELDIIARVSQRGAGDDSSFDDLLRPDADREETWELGIGPSIETELGARLRVRGGYRFATTRSSETGSVGSDTHALDARLDTVIDRHGTFGFAGVEGTEVRFEDDGSGSTSSIGLGLGRPFGQTLVAAVSAGLDRIEAGEPGETVEETFWNAALRWEPNEQVRATLGYGERAFGRRPSASLVLSGRRSSVEFRWSRALSLSGGAAREDTFSAPFDEGDSDVPLAESEESALEEVGTLSPFAEDVSRVRERIDVVYSLTGRISELTASAGWFDDERLGGRDPASPLDGGPGIPTSVASGDSRGAEFGLELTRTLSRRVELSSRYRHVTTRRDGETGRVRVNLLELRIGVEL